MATVSQLPSLLRSKLVLATCPVPDLNGDCWIWMGAATNGGYGKITISIGNPPWPERKTLLTHRFSYQYLIGEIPNGLTLDHLCRNRACCPQSCRYYCNQLIKN